MKSFSPAVPAAVVAAVVVLTACGSSSKKTDAGAASSARAGSSTAASSTARSAAPTSTARAVTPLSAVVLQQSDLPSTFTKSAPEATDPNEAAAHAAVVKCIGGANTDSHKVGKASSSFDQGNNSISSTADRFTSQKDVDTDTGLLHSAKFDACQEQAARKTMAAGLPAGSKVDDISMKTTVGTNGGPSNVAAIGRATVTVTSGGQTVKIYTVVAYLTGPKIEAEVDVTGVGAPIDDKTTEQAITAVADRAAKAES